MMIYIYTIQYPISNTPPPPKKKYKNRKQKEKNTNLIPPKPTPHTPAHQKTRPMPNSASTHP